MIKSAIQTHSIVTAAEPTTPLPDIVNAGYQHHLRGTLYAPILVVCDPPQPMVYANQTPLSTEGLKLIWHHARQNGFTGADFLFVGLCPPMPTDAQDSASRKWAHVRPCVESLQAIIEANNPRCIVTLGDLATRAVTGRQAAITKARGQVQWLREGLPLFPMLSPSFVFKLPEHRPTFESDWGTLGRFAANNFAVESLQTQLHYEWREDIQDILDLRPQLLAVDTETTGLRWYDPTSELISVQLAYKEGHAVVCPLDPVYWPEWKGRMRQRSKLYGQLKHLLEDPTIAKVGHHFKFDVHFLRKIGINVEGWQDDTQQLAFAVDENMLEKSQEECVRRWVPEMTAVKASIANSEKSDMRSLSRDRFLQYAGGDPDEVLRIRSKLLGILQEDPAQLNCYRRVMMPALRTFADHIERVGMLVNQDYLTEFGDTVRAFIEPEYRRLIQMVPPAVRLSHLAANKELKFSRPDFVRDALFTPDGFGLRPVVFTKGTRRLKGAQQVASTSAKEHLPFFNDRVDTAGEFVRGLIGFQKAETLAGTFIGTQAENNGLWQYIAPSGRIYPSYGLSTAVTGRTNSRDPNGQNFPKRGTWAKAYQQIFQASPGFKLVNCDLSQIELRIAAWMANDRRMLEIYRDGGDIHAATAAIVTGVTLETFKSWQTDRRKLADVVRDIAGAAPWLQALNPSKRLDVLVRDYAKFRRGGGKPVNFGFLYGMGANKFRGFAKTDYDVTFTERESFDTRERFFSGYAGLLPWHDRMRQEARATGCVRALHGAVRHLPSIHSSDEVTRASAERQAINSPVQRLGSDLGLIAMSRFAAQADSNIFRMIGFVHDALVLEVRDGYEREGISALLWVMNNAPLQDWFGITAPLPLLAEADIGLNLGQMLELADLPPEEKQPAWFREMGWQDAVPIKPEWWDDRLDLDPDQIRIRISR